VEAAVLVVELRAVGEVVGVTVVVVEVRGNEGGAEAFVLGLLPHPTVINATGKRLAIVTIRVDLAFADSTNGLAFSRPLGRTLASWSPLLHSFLGGGSG
jgi:hypothetical protein